MVNDGIRARELRIIGSDGEQLGVKSKSDALQIAEAANLDLVLVSPNANPPVARIMDYGKFRFDQQKREREARKNQKVVSLKEVRLSPSIDENDFQTKNFQHTLLHFLQVLFLNQSQSFGKCG